MFRLTTKFLTGFSSKKYAQLQKYQQGQFKSLMSQSFNRFSTETEHIIQQQKPEEVKFQKKPLRLFLGFLILNGLLGFAYMKKLEYDNRYEFKILMKLLEFKKQYQNDSSKYTLEEIKKLLDEFLVENVQLSLNEQITGEIRKIAVELCEKYPNEREIQMFASQVSEYEKYAFYLKNTLAIDRKYVDDVLIRQMALNCERYGKQKSFYFDEFYNACTKYSLDNRFEEADKCLNYYLALNPSQYYRAAVQQIKNYQLTNNFTLMTERINDLLNKEKCLDNKEIDYLLSFVKKFPPNQLKEIPDQITAAKLLLEHQADFSQKYVKQVLDKDKNNLQALFLQSQIYSKNKQTEKYNQVINQINKLNPTFLSSQQQAGATQQQ
ncbi:hypothetical protein ABPG72_019377 [Tetrahymena utriculariae]